MGETYSPDGRPPGRSWRRKPEAALNWTGYDFKDTGWKTATRRRARSKRQPWASVGGLLDWPGYDASAPYLAHLTLYPAAVLPLDINGQSQIEGLRALTRTGPGPENRANLPKTLTAPDPPSLRAGLRQGADRTRRASQPKAGPRIVGTGRVARGGGQVSLGRASMLEVGARAAGLTPYSAFRYANLTLPAAPTSSPFTLASPSTTSTIRSSTRAVRLLRSSADRIWYTGAYTAHLCMQEDIWDAPKRDRARWMGDLHVSGEVINVVFADSS